jgi:plastocyanin
VTGTLAGCSAPSAGDGNDGDDTDRKVVELTDDLVFDPDELTVSNGDTVVWENVGSVEHSVTAYADQIPDGSAYFASGGFGSEQAARDAYPEGSIAGGESFEHPFETTGTYEYFCIPHEGAGMTGTIEVA